ncbi:MAG TPA: hypothetical protein VJB87_05550 [Candidatus Nanoarchaeia archaeon]|nr:hypothetical protein [Candidatus Nanoarchaeia archaeon]
MSLLNKLRDAGKWAVPALVSPNVDDQLAKAKSYDPVRLALQGSKSRDEYNRLEDVLRHHLVDTNAENGRLHHFAGLLDTYDHALVPVDAVADYMKIMGGSGFALSAAKEIVEAPAKMAYNSYYLGKTHDLMGFLKNIVYEGLSFLLPGSLLDLTNRYVHQADKYAVKQAVDRFDRDAKQGRLFQLPRKDSLMDRVNRAA